MNPKRIIELICRLYVFVFLNIYGLAKLIGGQFYQRGELPAEVANSTLAEASAFDLAWTFMGYSLAYMSFIGLSEIIGACLLLWDRTKLLGVTILIPIMVNVIVFDIIFLDAYGALASACIYFIMLLTILYLNQGRVKEVWSIMTRPSQTVSLSFQQNWKTWGLVLVCMALIFFGIDQVLVNYLGHGKG